MKRIGKAILKVVAVLCGVALFVALIFGTAKVLYQGCAYVMSALQLYWNVAKNNVVESAIFYALIAIAVFAIGQLINWWKNRKEK